MKRLIAMSAETYPTPDPATTLAAWRAVTEGATEGPWAQGADQLDLPGFVMSPQTCAGCGEDWPLDPADADFIATARDAMPRLLAFAEAVLALHRRNRPEDGGCQGWTPEGYGDLDDWCVECSAQSGREYGTPWPCRTAALALDLTVADEGRAEA